MCARLLPRSSKRRPVLSFSSENLENLRKSAAYKIRIFFRMLQLLCFHTLLKTAGVYLFLPKSELATSVIALPLACVCFQQPPTIKFCNSFLLITMQIAGGVGTPGGV